MEISDKLSSSLDKQNSLHVFQKSQKANTTNPSQDSSNLSRGHRKLLIFACCAAFFVAGGVFTFLALSKQSTKTAENKAESQDAQESIAEVPKPKITAATAKYLFAGTTFWGRRTNTDAHASKLGVEYPFSELKTLDRASYDAWIAGLECPITDKGHSNYEENTLLKFNCDPDYLSVAKNYFTAFGLGSNHTGNHGVAGLAMTRKYLSENGIQYFGTPKRTATDTQEQDEEGIDNCSVLILPVKASYDDGKTRTLQIPYGFCSAHGVYGLPGNDYRENIKTYAAVLPTIVMPHMGAEYKASNDEMRQNLYRSMIDAGAESVIADHPHWIQNTEAYKGRLIAYSLGNFMFDQTFNKEVSRSAAIEANATFANSADLESWHKLGESCLEDKTTCFTKIQEANLLRPTISWAYDYHGTTSANSRITRLASDAEQVEIGKRLNWQTTMSNLKP